MLKEKLGSGRFLMTVAAAVCFLILTLTLSIVLIKKANELKINDLLPYVSSILIILSNIFTFYFTKRVISGQTDIDIIPEDGNK